MQPVEVNERIASIVDDIRQGKHDDLLTYKKLAPVYDVLFAESYNYEVQAEYVGAAVDTDETIQLLEVGCGTGRLLETFAERFPNVTLDGIDLHEEMVELSERRLDGLDNVSVHYADVFDWQGEYDVVVAFNTLPHFGSQRLTSFFEHSSSLLKTDGVLVFDYKDPRNNPNGLYDVWNAGTDKFSITARFLTIRDNDSHYAISYQFSPDATEETYWTGELMEVAFQTPDELRQELRTAGVKNVKINRGVGDQSGIVTAEM